MRRTWLFLFPLVLSGCAPIGPSFLYPRGPIAGSERDLLFYELIVMLFVIVPVFILTPLFAWRYRYSNRRAVYRPKWSFSWPLEILIWGGPIVIVILLALVLLRETLKLDPYRAIDSANSPLNVEVVGLDWKWLFIYPAQNIATVNELAFPANRPVHLTLTSCSVMQSFLIPQLAGQIFAMAGMRTQLNFSANSPGKFLGENTQFDGLGFQNQRFQVVAMTTNDFERWLAQAKASGAALNQKAFQTITKKSIVSKPLFYGAIEPGLFREIIASFHHGAQIAQHQSESRK